MKILKKIIGLVKKVVKGFKGFAKCSFKLEGKCIEKGFRLSGEVKAEVDISAMTGKEEPCQKD